MKSKSSVAVACFLPGRAKDLSAPPVRQRIFYFAKPPKINAPLKGYFVVSGVNFFPTFQDNL
jgi:hypothetical protein